MNTDVELAIFEADHGDPRRGVTLARAAWARRAERPLRRRARLGADARGPRREAGLRWAHRALRLGSLDPSLRYHAGMTALRRRPPRRGPPAPARSRSRTGWRRSRCTRARAREALR